MIDVASKNVYVILKYGFNKKYLNREVFARRTFPFLAIPKISQLNLEDWYCEEYVSGKSPDRIESKKGKEILEGVYKQYIMVIKQTKKNQNLGGYLKILEKEISENIVKINNIKKKTLIKLITLQKL